MDWFPRETFLATAGLDEFDYEVETSLPLTVIQKFNPGVIERFDNLPEDSPPESPPSGTPSEASTREFWERFRRSPLFQYKAKDRKSRLPSGLCIFFCPRADDVFETIPSELSDLCITRNQWQEIATKFCLYNLLVKAIRQKLTSITVTSHKLSPQEPYGETSDTLQMYTVNTSVPSGQNFALSATHFENANLTLAVILGATPRQVEKVDSLLGNAQEAIGHPLLMLGLAAELMLDLLTDPVESMRDGCIRMARESRKMLSITGKKGTEYALQVEAIRSESQWLDEAVKTTKQNLVKALEACCPDRKENGNDRDLSVTACAESGATQPGNTAGRDDERSCRQRNNYVEQKMKTRFQDIFLQLDALITVTRISVQDMSSMSTTIMAELTRRDAADSAKTAKTGTLIAFLAMLYLPITSVATIFAMPIFNFQNDWRDMRYQPAPAGLSADPPSQSGSTEAHAPVSSGQFWIFLAVSLGLTFVTLEGWWRFAGADANRSLNPENGSSKLPHWTLYPIWPLIQRYLPPSEDGPESSEPSDGSLDSSGNTLTDSTTILTQEPRGCDQDKVTTTTSELGAANSTQESTRTEARSLLHRMFPVERKPPTAGDTSGCNV